MLAAAAPNPDHSDDTRGYGSWMEAVLAGWKKCYLDGRHAWLDGWMADVAAWRDGRMTDMLHGWMAG